MRELQRILPRADALETVSQELGHFRRRSRRPICVDPVDPAPDAAAHPDHRLDHERRRQLPARSRPPLRRDRGDPPRPTPKNCATTIAGPTPATRAMIPAMSSTYSGGNWTRPWGLWRPNAKPASWSASDSPQPGVPSTTPGPPPSSSGTPATDTGNSSFEPRPRSSASVRATTSTASKDGSYGRCEAPGSSLAPVRTGNCLRTASPRRGIGAGQDKPCSASCFSSPSL